MWQVCFVEGSQTSPICPDKRSVEIEYGAFVG